MKAIFDEVGGTYAIDGAAVEAVQVKGAAEAVAQQSRVELAKLVDRLQSGQIELQEFYEAFKRETKYLHMASAALGRGGFDNMRPQDWRRVERIVFEQWNGIEGQFPGLRSFAGDIERGRYGAETLRPAVGTRAALYAEAGRATYENERLNARAEKFPSESRRVLGAYDHCRDCVAWARLGWMASEVMQSEYPIAASVCGSKCGCIIETRRATAENQVANLVRSMVKLAVPAATVSGVALFFLSQLLRARVRI